MQKAFVQNYLDNRKTNAQQANRRLYRMGQTEPVFVHHILIKDTLDKWVLEEVLTPKEERQEQMLLALKAKIEESAHDRKSKKS